MKNYLFPTVVLAVVVLSAVALAQNENAKRPEGGPPAMGIHWAKGVHPASAHGGRSPLMLWHNGPILTDSVVQVIYCTLLGSLMFFGSTVFSCVLQLQ